MLTVAITFATKALAISTAANPTPPAAVCTKIQSLDVMKILSASATIDVVKTIRSTAAIAKSTLIGI
jgi:hypothetical protein